MFDSTAPLDRLACALIWDQVQDDYRISDAGMDQLQRWWTQVTTQGPARYGLHKDRPGGDNARGNLAFGARILLAVLTNEDDPIRLAGTLALWSGGKMTFANAMEALYRRNATDVPTLRRLLPALAEAGGYRGLDLDAIGVSEKTASRVSRVLATKQRLMELRLRVGIEAVENGHDVDWARDEYNAQVAEQHRVGPGSVAVVRKWLDAARPHVEAEVA